jgi:S-adenosylmethionine synthetase
MTSFKDHSERDYHHLDLDAMSDSDIGRLTAKDQVTVFGYACDQTDALMPLPIWLAHRIARRLDDETVKRAVPDLLPDAKTQVGVEFVNNAPSRIYSIAIETSQRHADRPNPEALGAAVREHVIDPVFADESLKPDGDTRLFINPEGPLIGGGPAAHSGLTGRKTGIDTYGEYARHSGAALSGKDPMRIDRVGAYAARWAAKHVVAAGLARECEVQLSYSIGKAGPVSVRVRTSGSSTGMADADIARRLSKIFDFRLGAIVRDLRLRRLPAENPDGFYRRLATYGHVGRVDLELPWERLDRVDALKA